MFERLRDAIESMLDAASTPESQRDVVRGMHDAVIEARVSIEAMRDSLAKVERQLAVERQQLDDANRRGQLAKNIGDEETAKVAEEFSSKHRERVHILERKASAQRDELSMAEGEFVQMRRQLDEARKGVDPRNGGAAERLDEAWREIDQVASTSSDRSHDDGQLRHQFDRAVNEAAAEAKLRELKKKMGK